jgi:hypothetical protein
MAQTREEVLAERRARVVARERAKGIARQRRVGFRPVITRLPTGTSFSTNGIVSADRRYVRIGVNVGFSSIGAVHTFNMYTGETRRTQ